MSTKLTLDGLLRVLKGDAHDLADRLEAGYRKPKARQPAKERQAAGRGAGKGRDDLARR